MLIIDEGWGNLDDTNTENIPLIYGTLREEYKYTILISHEQEFKSLIDKEIGIEVNEEGYSKVKYV